MTKEEKANEKDEIKNKFLMSSSQK